MAAAARTRIEAQVEIIERGLPGARPFADPRRADAEGPAYLAHSSRVLVRDEALARAQLLFQAHLPDPRPASKSAARRTKDAPEAPPPPVSRGGFTILELEPRNRSLDSLLEEADLRLGPGVVTPDHVFFLTASSCCPATEPMEVPAGAGPVPPVRPATWPGCCDGRGVLVSVLDTGLFAGVTAPWMAGVTGDPENTYVPGTTPPRIREYAGHGAFCAGTVRTVAPKADVRVENAFEVAGAAFESDLAVQVVQALAGGPDILCLAFGAPTRGDLAPLGFEVLRRQVAQRKGVVVVAAAGCDGSRAPFWPAAAPWTLSVGALDDGGRARAPWSNFGGWVDVFVPGENFVNVFPSGVYECTEPPDAPQIRTFAGMANWSGTSFSCALMCGILAAHMSATGLSAPHAAGALLDRARQQAGPGTGPVLYPAAGCHCARPPATST